jgi:alpha-ketoglutarate-dependent taurine dioxygenase
MYTIHNNGWTVILDSEFNLLKATQKDINTLGKLLAKYTVIVQSGQHHLTLDDERKVTKMFGNIEKHDVASNPLIKSAMVENSNDEINRVTGALDKDGLPGLFGHDSELDWHCNKPAVPDRMPVVWLFAVKQSKGSRTSFTNNIMAYEDLDLEIKKEIKDLKLVCGFSRGSYTTYSFGKDQDFNEYYTPPLVYTNNGNQTGLFFPFLQFRNFVGMTEEESLPLTKLLKDHILQEKYIYHHDWEDGDAIMFEQWLGLHKRWEFPGMTDRLLHRICFDFTNCDLSD